MPRPRTRRAGILPPLLPLLALTLLSGCSLLEPVPQGGSNAPAPTPSGAGGAWVLDLTVSGDVGGTLNQVAPDTAGQRSVCTGRRGTGADTWAMTFYSFLGRDLYGVQVTVSGYRGPGTYGPPQASMQLFKPDNSAVWRTSAGDAFSFTIAGQQDSGKLDATLTNLTNDSSKVHMTGTWSCQT